MAKRKYHYYTLVFTSYGPVYVTKVHGFDRTAEWNKLEKPLEMSRDDAQFLAIGLTVNGNRAVCVSAEYLMEYQPYYYDKGQLHWEDNDK